MLLFCDGAQHYDTAHLTSKYTTAQASVSTAAKRGGTYGINIGTLGKTLAPRDNLVIGFAYRVNNGSGATFGGTPYRLRAITTGRSIIDLFQLALFNDGTFAMYAGNSVLIVHETSFSMVNASWAYIEIKLNLSASTNVVVQAELRINGKVVGSGTATAPVAVSSLLAGNATGSFHVFAAGNASVGDTYFTDMYICDQQGGVNDDYLGDVLIGAIYPRSDVHIDMVPTGGGASYTQVNEHIPDDDSTYVHSATIADYDTWYFDNVASFAGSIVAVQFLLYMRKDNEGARIVKHIAGNDDFEGPEQYLNDTYFYHHTPWDVDPVSGAPWTPALVNGQPYGVKITG